MTHDTPERYDAEGMLTQMRSILDRFDEERRFDEDIPEGMMVDIYVGLMLGTIEELWMLVQHSDIKRPDEILRLMQYYQGRACAAVIGDLCRQPDWDNGLDPAEWDTYSETIRTLRWLLELYEKEEDDE
jgi:hypothetical protein